MINLVLPPVIAEMYAQGRTGRLERTLRTFSTIAGVPSAVFPTGFMLLGGPIWGLVYGDYYRHGAEILVLLSAAKVAAVCSRSCGLVLQMTGHHKQTLRVILLTRLLFIVGAPLVVWDYGPMEVAAATVTTVPQNVIMVLTAKRLTKMWTHMSFSLSSFRKALLNR
jgi:O-antigen/teichoic acid export membrane protein